jgi:hypothetical protein
MHAGLWSSENVRAATASGERRRSAPKEPALVFNHRNHAALPRRLAAQYRRAASAIDVLRSPSALLTIDIDASHRDVVMFTMTSPSEASTESSHLPCIYCREPMIAGTFAYLSSAKRLVSATCPACSRRVTLATTTWRRWREVG